MTTSKVVLGTLVLALTMFLILPSAVWAENATELYRTKCAVCHGATGRADTPMAKKQDIPAFGSERVRKQTNAEIADFILNGGTEKKSSHAWAHKGVSTEDGTKLAAYVKQLGSTK
jgi:mono/diheme cytochrome c family protein